MSVANVSADSSIAVLAATGRIFLPGAREFAETLNIGQIIQGKVMRSLTGHRYLVAFGQDERIVDSAVTLSSGETLRGRVVALGDRVELQRIYPDERQPKTPVSEAPAPLRGTDELSGVDALLQRYQAQLQPAERAILARAAEKSADPESMALAGIMLSKLGLPLQGVLLEALYRAQSSRPNGTSSSPAAPDSTAQISVSPGSPADTQATPSRVLAELLAQLLEVHSPELPQAGAPATGAQAQGMPIPLGVGDGMRRQQSDPQDSSNSQRMQQALAEHLMNAQTGGIVAHRAGLLPLLVGGRLVEISFALFEQKRSSGQTSGLQHRQVIFSLQTAQLGQVDVLARMSGTHVRLQITTANEESTARAAEHVQQLRGALIESGWAIDEVVYATRFGRSVDSVARSVVEHVASLESFNRLV
jgi:hypothetical protein